MPGAYNSLRYDWMKINDSKYKFFFIDENIKNINLKFFKKKIDMVLLDLFDENKLVFFDFNYIDKSDFIFDLDYFFLKESHYASPLLKFNLFQCNDFMLLSDEFFDFYPIIKKFMLNKSISFPKSLQRNSTFGDSGHLIKDFFNIEAIPNRLTLSSSFWQKTNKSNDIPDIDSLSIEFQSEKTRFFHLNRLSIFEIYLKALSRTNVIRYDYFSKNSDFDNLNHFYDENFDMIIDFDNSHDFFRFICYFPIIKYKLQNFYDKLKVIEENVTYDRRRELILNKLDLSKFYIRLHPDLKLLTSLLKATQKRHEIVLIDYLPKVFDIAYIKYVLHKTPFNGGFPIFAALDSKVNFFPKKFNRIFHEISQENKLNIPRDFDDMHWSFWNLSLNFFNKNFFNFSKSNIKNSIFNYFIDQNPFWFFRKGFNDCFFYFNNNLNKNFFWSSFLDSNDFSFDFLHIIAKTKMYNKSLYAGKFDKVRENNISIKKKKLQIYLRIIIFDFYI